MPISLASGARTPQSFSDPLISLMSLYGTAALMCCLPLFSGFQTLALVLSALNARVKQDQVRQERNQSLGQPLYKPEHWMPSPLFISMLREEPWYGVCSCILCTMLHRVRDMNKCAKFCKFFYSFHWNLFLALQWPGCCSFSTNL